MVGPDKLCFVNQPMRTNTAANTAPATGATAPTATSDTSTTVAAAERRWYPDHAILAGAAKDSVKAMSEFIYK